LPYYPNDFTYIEFISINNDEDFLDYNITGLGTKEDPYIIENIVLEDERHDFGIAVRDTTKYFVIRNCILRAYTTCITIENVSEGTATIFNNTCFVHPPSPSAVGIGIFETNGAIVRNNNCTREKGGITFYEGTIGIFIRNSNNTMVVGNICEKQDMYGIILHSSKNNLFEENSCILNDVGIYVYSSNDGLFQNNQFEWNQFGILTHDSSLSIINNTISFNEVYGIILTGCKLSNITANSICFNGIWGVVAISTNQSQFTYNHFTNNTEYGLCFDSYSDNNTIHHNRFVYNNVGGESQAQDHGKNNLWYDKEKEEGN
jgi:parallel beta-helix repeat protein